MNKTIEIKKRNGWTVSINTSYIVSVEYHVSIDMINGPDKGILNIFLLNGEKISETWTWCGSNPNEAEEKYNELMKILKGESDDTEISF